MLHNLYHSVGSNFSTDCEICFSEKRNTIFLPCKHSCCCKNCAESIIKRKISCSICRKDIYDLIIIDDEIKKNNDAEKQN